MGFAGVLLVALAGCVLDADHDGVREILFTGDSNTHLLTCAYPLAWQMRHDPATVRGYDEGVYGDRAQHWYEDGLLLAAIARDGPDAVVIALGTNDLGTGHSPEDVLLWLFLLAQQAEGAGVSAYVATVPPIYDPDGIRSAEWDALMLVEVRALNAMIRQAFAPQRVVDFDSWMPAQWSPEYYVTWKRGDGSVSQDGVHVSCKAHAIRADVVDGLLDDRLTGFWTSMAG